MKNSLPQHILSVVTDGRIHSRSPKRLVQEVHSALRDRLRPIHRAMCSSRMDSIRKNAEPLRSLYSDGALASCIFQAAYDGSKDEQTRLREISNLITKRLEHILGLLKGFDAALYEKLRNLVCLQSAPARTQLAA